MEGRRTAVPAGGWTCFHCGEVFTTYGAAADHFGSVPEATAACRIKLGGERGLVMALRKLERHVIETTGELPPTLYSGIDESLVEWVTADVTAEMKRQESLYPHSPQHSDETWAVILMEEVGEVADAVHRMAWDEDLHRELIQVAATAMSWQSRGYFDLTPRLELSLLKSLRETEPGMSENEHLVQLMRETGDVARAVNEGTPTGDLLHKIACTSSAWACDLTIPGRLRE